MVDHVDELAGGLAAHDRRRAHEGDEQRRQRERPAAMGLEDGVPDLVADVRFEQDVRHGPLLLAALERPDGHVGRVLKDLGEQHHEEQQILGPARRGPLCFLEVIGDGLVDDGSHDGVDLAAVHFGAGLHGAGDSRYGGVHVRREEQRDEGVHPEVVGLLKGGAGCDAAEHAEQHVAGVGRLLGG